MTPEEVLESHIKGSRSIEDSKLLAAASLITANRTRELVDASTLLARTTQVSADLLAKTTQASADLLAKTTEKSADQLSKSNEVSAVLLAKTTETSAALLAQTTEASAERLRASNEISVRQMKWLTVAVIAVGVIQVVLAIIALFISLRLE